MKVREGFEGGEQIACMHEQKKKNGGERAGSAGKGVTVFLPVSQSRAWRHRWGSFLCRSNGEQFQQATPPLHR